jgi:alpha-1,6-mannosyltransferase
LAAASLVCALYLCVALTVLGLDKFHYVMAGGRKFATFPDWKAQLGIGSSYLLLNLLYLIWFLRTKQLQPYPRFISLFRWTAVFLVLAFIAYPLGDDIYIYLHSGLMNLSQVNPFLTRVKAFTTELSPYVDWGQTSTYGPLSQLLFTASAAVVSIHPVVAVYFYKAVCLGLHILNGYLIWRVLPHPDRDKITLAYLLNPLLLMEQVGSGHVDILVSTSAIVGIASLTSQRYVSASVALWGGLLSKTLPVMWMPLVGIFLFRQRRWKQLVVIGLFSVALFVALWLTVLPGIAAWKSLLNPGVAGQYQTSIPAMVKSWLEVFRIFSPNSITVAQINQLLLKVSHYLLISFFSYYIWVALRGYTRRHYTELNLVEDIGWSTLTLLLFATPWLMPWYASVLFAIAALIPQSQLFGLTCLVFGFSSSAQYLLQGHNTLKTIVGIGLPILVLLFGPTFLKSQSTEVPERATVRS